MGEAVSRDELLVDIETDKVVLEVVAPADGVLTTIHKDVGETVLSEEVLGVFEVGAAASAAGPATTEAAPATTAATAESSGPGGAASPAARKAASELGVELAQVRGSGRDGRITKEDVEKAAAAPASAPAQAAEAPKAPAAPASETLQRLPGVGQAEGERPERRVPMTRLRASIARRLVEAQQTAAMLTTFNEVNMQPAADLRARYKDDFEKAHNGTRLGFMSFFVRAATEALKRFPAVNGSIDGNDIVYHGYYDVAWPWARIGASWSHHPRCRWPVPRAD